MRRGGHGHGDGGGRPGAMRAGAGRPADRAARPVWRHPSAAVRAGAAGAFRGRLRQSERPRGAGRGLRAPAEADPDRDAVQPADAGGGCGRPVRAGPCGGMQGGGRQHLPVAGPAAAHRPGRRSGHPFDDQIPQRPLRRGRRLRRGQGPGRPRTADLVGQLSRRDGRAVRRLADPARDPHPVRPHRTAAGDGGADRGVAGRPSGGQGGALSRAEEPPGPCRGGAPADRLRGHAQFRTGRHRGGADAGRRAAGVHPGGVAGRGGEPDRPSGPDDPCGDDAGGAGDGGDNRRPAASVGRTGACRGSAGRPVGGAGGRAGSARGRRRLRAPPT